MTMRTLFVAIMLTLFLSACNGRLLQHTVNAAVHRHWQAPAVDIRAGTRAALERAVAREAEARKSGEWPAFQALVHRAAGASWLQQQRNSFASPLDDIAITRIARYGNWALAAVIETSATEDGGATQFYTTRTLRWSPAGDWQLTSPSLPAWGKERTLTAANMRFIYRAFDEPYIRAVAPRIALILPQMAADFGAAVAADEQFQVQVTPVATAAQPPFSLDPLLLTVPSPLSPGFSLGSAQSPEEFLLGYLADMLGHALINKTFGEQAQEAGRLALAHTAVQWEAEQAVRRDYTSHYVAKLGATPISLSSLLDPTTDDATGSRRAEQNLFVRFAIATYGRESIAPFLQAVFTTGSADALVRSAFGKDLSAVEQQWQVWLGQQPTPIKP